MKTKWFKYQSESDVDTFYSVSMNAYGDWNCNCPSNTFRNKPCKHIESIKTKFDSSTKIAKWLEVATTEHERYTEGLQKYEALMDELASMEFEPDPQQVPITNKNGKKMRSIEECQALLMKMSREAGARDRARAIKENQIKEILINPTDDNKMLDNAL